MKKTCLPWGLLLPERVFSFKSRYYFEKAPSRYTKANDVILKLMRHNVASTSIQRHFDGCHCPGKK